MPAAQVAHHLPGRLRIRVPDRRGDRVWAAAAAAGLAACPGVRGVRTRALTGGLVIHYDGDVADVARFAARHGLFVLASPGSFDQPPDDGPGLRAMRLDVAARDLAGVDPWTTLAVVLFTLALLQVRRGNVLGPATSLAWAALSAWRRAGATARSPAG